MVTDTGMGTDTRKDAMNIRHNTNNNSSSSRTKDTITIMRSRRMVLERRRNLHAIGSATASGLRALRRLSVG
jgi:hypothetical protein